MAMLSEYIFTLFINHFTVPMYLFLLGGAVMYYIFPDRSVKEFNNKKRMQKERVASYDN